MEAFCKEESLRKVLVALNQGCQMAYFSQTENPNFGNF
jgi:hypothetical protein